MPDDATELDRSLEKQAPIIEQIGLQPRASIGRGRGARVMQLSIATAGVGFYLVAHSSLPSSLRRLAIVGLVIAIIFTLTMTGLYMNRRYTAAAKGFAFMVLFITAILTAPLPVVFLDADGRIFFLKIGGILFFSLLPTLLYLQFIAVKGDSLRDEFVLNLHRLRIDSYENLPTPPPASVFYRSDLPQSGADNIYIRKFEGLFGRPLTGRSDQTAVRFQAGTLLPLVYCTILLAAGWSLVLQPETLSTPHLGLGTFQLSGHPALPTDALRFGFIGAYFFILQMLIRRYFQDDLKTSAYINATARIIVATLLITAVHNVWNLSSMQENAFAFLIGVFPQLGLKALQNLIALPLRRLMPSLRQDYPLSDLDGLNIWYESRLLEEGIEDMQNLSTANLVDVLLRTRVPVDRLVDWVDQAHLYLRVSGTDGEETKKAADSSRAKLRRLGVRTATDLEDVFEPWGGEQAYGKGMLSTTEDHQVMDAFRWALNGTRGDGVSVTTSLIKSLRREPNLFHVRAWKSFMTYLETPGKQQAPQGEPIRLPDTPIVPSTEEMRAVLPAAPSTGR